VTLQCACPRAIVTVVVPPTPDQSFASDNAAGAHPRVIEALRDANVGSALPYGQDPWTIRSADRFRALFEANVEVFYTYGGTGANVVALQCLLASHEAVICPTSAHINVDECGAPERFTGAKLIDVPSSDGKLNPGTVRGLLQTSHDEHHVTPRVIAISQSTELGTLYTVDEISELARLAHEHGLFLYVDGARIANAVDALGCSVRELTYDAGVDVLTFGGTKNGLLYGEAVVFLRPELAHRARFARKQAGQLASKMRFIAAQFDVLLQDDLWLASAANANDMARRLASRVAGIPHIEIVRPVEVNSLFARVPAMIVNQLQNWSFFWNWDLNDNVVRWMTSFATSDEDVMRFAEGVRYFANLYGPPTRAG
jgi:threonine aldolase